jgi:hypothetical protein
MGLIQRKKLHVKNFLFSCFVKDTLHCMTFLRLLSGLEIGVGSRRRSARQALENVQHRGVNR